MSRINDPRAAASAEHRKQTKVCQHCGETFSPSAHRQVDRKAWAARKFCGKACTARGIMKRPEVVERQAATIKANFSDPAYRARHSAMAIDNFRRGAATRRKHGIGWIPDDLRGMYRKMRFSCGAPEARRMMREYLAAMARRQVNAVLQQMKDKAEKQRKQAY
ncbi:hypothetical protein [Sphingomonas sp.]|uniref:hypothetical protein n=1 Tax=Sphingomonas sp. TaxID=28214 RepID=UPI003B3A83D3